MTSSTYPSAPPAAPLLAHEPKPQWPAADDASAAARLAMIDLLGGRQILKSLPQSRVEIHGVLVQGLPCAALVHLADHLRALSAQELADALGISARTLRRQKDQPDKALAADLASKTWQFAETLAQAIEVFGGRDAAERWMARPAMGLDGARPIDLLRTLQGTELVTEFLGRLEHGVYN